MKKNRTAVVNNKIAAVDSTVVMSLVRANLGISKKDPVETATIAVILLVRHAVLELAAPVLVGLAIVVVPCQFQIKNAPLFVERVTGRLFTCRFLHFAVRKNTPWSLPSVA